jgi:hypothetical protein
MRCACIEWKVRLRIYKLERSSVLEGVNQSVAMQPRLQRTEGCAPHVVGYGQNSAKHEPGYSRCFVDYEYEPGRKQTLQLLEICCIEKSNTALKQAHSHYAKTDCSTGSHAFSVTVDVTARIRLHLEQSASICPINRGKNEEDTLWTSVGWQRSSK